MSVDKFKYYRDPDLLRLAEGQECLLRISRRCLTTEGTTTVACHENSQTVGKGGAIKSSDSRTVWGCYHCHTLLDQGQINYEDRQKAFETAHVWQIDEWLKIAQNPCLKPWRVEAARKVLDHIGVPYA